MERRKTVAFHVGPLGSEFPPTAQSQELVTGTVDEAERGLMGKPDPRTFDLPARLWILLTIITFASVLAAIFSIAVLGLIVHARKDGDSISEVLTQAVTAALSAAGAPSNATLSS